MADPYPYDELDGPVAAPDHHRVVFENEHVRVLQTVIPPGAVAPLHTHLLRHVMLVESGGHYVRRDEAGEVLIDTRERGADYRMQPFAWSDGTPRHTLENIGDVDIRLMSVELKD